MSQVTEQSVRFQTALASIKLIQASAVLDLTEDDFDFLTSNKVWIATDRSRARRCVRSEERFSRNAETDLVCRLLLEKKKRATARLPFRRRHTRLTKFVPLTHLHYSPLRLPAALTLRPRNSSSQP